MIPDYQTAMRPLLVALSDGSVRRRRDVVEEVANHFGLDASERAKLLPSGRQRVIVSRVGWASTYLSQAGLVTRPARGQLQITDAGRTVLLDHPERVDNDVLRRFPAFQAFLGRNDIVVADDGTASTVDQEPPVPVDTGSAASPQDLLEQAVRANEAAVRGELTSRALAMTPTEFERLVIRLLERMGYGRAGEVTHTGKSGDAGIDGIISQDPLGLDRIYLQAKRYAADQTVQRPAVQGFVGALMGAQGDRGVFITTSGFSAGARAEADRVNARIELIDGERLAALMLRHGVGVQAETTAVLHQVDEDFFESL